MVTDITYRFFYWVDDPVSNSSSSGYYGNIFGSGGGDGSNGNSGNSGNETFHDYSGQIGKNTSFTWYTQFYVGPGYSNIQVNVRVSLVDPVNTEINITGDILQTNSSIGYSIGNQVFGYVVNNKSKLKYCGAKCNLQTSASLDYIIGGGPYQTSIHRYEYDLRTISL